MKIYDDNDDDGQRTYCDQKSSLEFMNLILSFVNYSSRIEGTISVECHIVKFEFTGLIDFLIMYEVSLIRIPFVSPNPECLFQQNTFTHR